MAETSPYPGSPSLSSEAREKVRQTFRHTIQLARSGRNEEALLGCDFILKMDARFQPARRLLETLRGVASGTIVDLAPFAEYAGDSAAPAAGAGPPSVAPPSMPPPSMAAPRPAAPPVKPAPAPAPPAADAGLDSLAFDDFAPVDAGQTVAVPQPLPPFPPAPQAAFEEPELAEVPSTTRQGPPPPPSPTPYAAAPGPAPMAPSAPSGGDPRIAQFLQQGDEAMARGNVQEAIDLWSRVFLIDLSNEDASQRIDSAREKQAESARRIDMLLAEGIHQFDAGDLAGARSKFLDVLLVSENDSTARSYLNQIEAAMAEKRSVTLGGSADFMKSELESPVVPSFAPDSFAEPAPGSGFGFPEPSYTEPAVPSFEAAGAPPAKKVRVGGGPLLLVGGALALAAIGYGVYSAFSKKPAPPRPVPTARRAKPPAGAPGAGTEAPPAGTATAADDPIAKAKALLEGGKRDEAEALLRPISPTDPRYTEVLVLLDRIKLSAPQAPVTAAPSAASLDEMRIAGMAAAKSSHYIDAVKALDPVVKARTDDVEAAQVLAKARERVAAIGSAVKAYNEQDYSTAIRLLWDLRKNDKQNQDVEEFLFRAYFNEGVTDLQAGNGQMAGDSFKEALGLRPGDAETQRHLKFAKKYNKGAADLLSRIYVKHLTPKP